MPDIALRTKQANDLQIAYLEVGEGPLAVLLHGFPDTARSWRPTLSALASAGFRAVAPFLRGYAPTEVPASRRATVEELAADAVGLINVLGGEAALLVGHDWGAATAYQVAARAPGRVAKLVAVGLPHPSTIVPSLRLAWVGRHFVTLQLPGVVSRLRSNDFAVIDRFVRRWSPTWRFGPEETADVKRCFAEPGSLETAIGYYRAVRPKRIVKALAGKVRVPTLAVAGEDDPALPVAAYEAARRKFAGDYQVVGLPGGHFVHRESPAAFHEALMAFVAMK